ncbi:MAG: hypothetical protein EAZ32_08090 [Cytophagia bacterium]|nr:MAG: hypothetical protein EAZ38_09285 [Cytophagales bacterium]TAG39961.1 MAG: hypothetical protein EAZ32_08090 [Cytophagia bacterium]TAG52506.1 MAG: hypothetical protein EAZ29_07360 [Runella slithyformis]TAG70799.1 MAG: hypothetical protein EAZ26_05730 [Runella slithyformis]TAG81694.1 MAG: hypothetical protein EAZ22_06770 [Cytophagales bacterium]
MKKILLIAGFWILTHGVSVAQCAMCRGSVESNMSTGRNVIANGLNGGILYLFVFPYLAVAVVGYLWYRNSKKLRAERIAVQTRVRQAMQN